MVSGRYFFPKAPVLCLKWMPALAVTSVNSMGPEGRAELTSAADEGAGAGVPGVEADCGDSTAGLGEAASEEFEGCGLQPANANKRSAARAGQHTILLRCIKIFRFPFTPL